MWVTLVRRYWRSRQFPSVEGKLLKAEISSESAGESSGFVPQVEFEYEVDGTMYRSRQLTALNVSVLRARAVDVKPVIDALQAMPKLEVYYDPQAPWDAFLKHCPVLAVFVPLLIGVPLAGILVLIVNSMGKM
jgi:hypothetical protein